jgi:hypothetical protein
MARSIERELLESLYALLRRMESCPGHDVPPSDTGVPKHHHYDPSRIGRPDTVQKNCTLSEVEAREAEYARLMGRVKALLSNAPS